MSMNHKGFPWIIAHRGAREEAPENTFSAFEHALTYPVDGIELDVQMSSDGVPVICHDPTLYRIVGQRRRVSNCTYAELATLDWGGWFDARFCGEPLPTLDQILKRLEPRTRLFIEIKADMIEQRNGRAYTLAETVGEILADPDYGLSTERVFVLSFDPEVLHIVHRRVPRYRCILNAVGKDTDQIMAAPKSALSSLWAIDMNLAGLTPTLIQWARRRGMHVFTYTPNRPAQAVRALELGVDGLITDRPGWLTRILGHS